jgi:hypothetical protein
MRPIGEAHSHWQAMAANAAWRARALQKPSATSNLNGESGQDADRQPPSQQEETGLTMRQGGTEKPVPFRHVRVTAAFAAQLLGQVLPDPERRFSSAEAYGQHRRPGLALDTLL